LVQKAPAFLLLFCLRKLAFPVNTCRQTGKLRIS
jgi:hypothetical protein